MIKKTLYNIDGEFRYDGEVLDLVYTLANKMIKESEKQVKYLKKSRYTDIDAVLIGQADGRLSASKEFLKLLTDNEEDDNA